MKRRLLFFFRAKCSKSVHEPIQNTSKIPLLKIMLGAGVLSYAYYVYKDFKEAMARESVYRISPYRLFLYRTLPLSLSTYLAGKASSWKIPRWLRAPLYGSFSQIYGCDLSECESLETYPTFNDFFKRKLRVGVRHIVDEEMVSPADGQILAYGKLDDTTGLFPEQIKGVRYPLEKFLGKESITLDFGNGKSLYYCTIYLAPGSYHRFHSPANDFKVKSVERVPGELLPVAPWLLRRMPGLVSLNERAVISGWWKYGRMFMVPVGALNVGSITIAEKIDRVKRGEEMGNFEMGSLIALVFEGPADFKFIPAKQQWLKYGEALGSRTSDKSWVSWFF